MWKLTSIAAACLLLAGVVHTGVVTTSNPTLVSNRHESRSLTGLTEDQLDAVIQNPAVSPIGFIALLAFGFVITWIIGLLILAPMQTTTTGRGFDGGTWLEINRPTLLRRLTMIHEAWQKFDIKDTQCRKRLICELHAVQPSLGTTAKYVITAVDFISYANVTSVPEWMQHFLKEYNESMHIGTETKECSKYNSCQYSFADQINEGDASHPHEINS